MVDNIKKKRLKTGLDILLGAENRKVYEGKYEKNEEDLALNISDIKPSLYQPRSYFDDNSIKELAHSIKEQGLLIDPIAYYDSETQSSKVDTKFYSYGLKLFFEDFDSDKQKEDLFIVKLAAFELDLVKNSENRDLKSKIRKAKDPIEILKILLEFAHNTNY